MKPDWVIHYNRLGECFRSPTESRLIESIKDALANKKDIEHTNTWIECGSNNGPLVVYSISSGGYGRITTYSDSDMTEEIQVIEKKGLNLEMVMSEWKKLIETGAV